MHSLSRTAAAVLALGAVTALAFYKRQWGPAVFFGLAFVGAFLILLDEQ